MEPMLIRADGRAMSFFLFDELLKDRFEARRKIFFDARHDDVFEFRVWAHHANVWIQSREADDRLRAGIVQLKFQFAGHVHRIVGGDNRAEL